MALTKSELENYELDHQHAGNGYVMIEDIDDDWCRVTCPETEPKQAWLVWKKKLSVSMSIETDDKPSAPIRIREKLMPSIRQLRREIRDGLTKVVDTHIIRK